MAKATNFFAFFLHLLKRLNIDFSLRKRYTIEDKRSVERSVPMQLHGLQKMTLLDYPGKVACTVFTGNCNLRCPFCHNASLVLSPGDLPAYTEEEILSFLKKRQGLLDGVCLTGGEPLLQKDVFSFLQKVKELGFSVKLDTNGFYSAKLKELVSAGLVDYVAMDVKNCMDKYAETVGLAEPALDAVEESIDFLLSGAVEFEFRTTVVQELHTVQDIERLAQRIQGAPRYFLQRFVDSGNLIGTQLSAPTEQTMRQMQAAAARYVKNTQLRGV